jgi:two-component system response regulator AtoC
MEAVVADAALVVGADPVEQESVTRAFRERGLRPTMVATLSAALAELARKQYLVTLVNVDVVGGDGVELLRRLEDPDAGPGSVVPFSRRSAGRAAAPAGALEREPDAPASLSQAVDEALESCARRRPPDPDEASGRLRRELALWRSPKMQEVLRIAQRAASADVTVLICGETGTGKDLVARAIHHLSPRRGRPLLRVNCAAVPRELLESELFGHERGAFTGAHQLKVGTFEAANHGTVFLDEIGELHPALQAKLLHVLQDGTFSRVGGKATIKVDVRVLAATNRELERAVSERQFREDLYYRLNVIQITVPPLRERLEEVPALVEYFVQRYSKLFKRSGFTLGPDVLERLARHQYPGNVRELENLVKRMIVLGDPTLTRTAWPTARPDPPAAPRRDAASEALSLKEIARNAARAAEREVMAKVLAQTGWNRVRAARLLKISYRALLYKIKDVGIGRDELLS